jgi:uncharacterized protein with ATP-grasp and redox domains
LIMKLGKDCFPCIIGNLLKLLNFHHIPADEEENLLRYFLSYLANADYEVSPPVFGREMHRMIRERLHINDPYAKIKRHYNQLMLNNYVHFRNMIGKSGDPFHTALRLAIAGNVIDFGSQHQFDIKETLERIAITNPSIDDSEDLQNSLRTARTLLYIGDNCGEIVLDRLFLETITVPNKYFAVRGQPVLNDVTIEDAKLVGIDKIATIISTGDDSPGVVWEYTSSEFKDIFRKSDVIISKGQGNLEGLIDQPANIYFLLVIKCDFIGQRLGAQRGDFIVKKSKNRVLDQAFLN